MSLFDDLLGETKTSTSNSSSGQQSGQSNPVVQISPSTPLIISESTPMNREEDSHNDVQEIHEESPVVQLANQETNMQIIETQEEMPIIMETPEEESHENTESSILINEKSSNENPLASLLTDTLSDNTQENTILDFSSHEKENTESSSFIVSDEQKTVLSQEVSSFQDTESFLSHLVSESDILISGISTALEAKNTEESEYRKQKEHFAEKEIQARSEGEKLLSEKQKAEEMKRYLQNQISTTDTNESNENTEEKEITASVETGLMGIAVAESVSETIATKTEELPTQKEEETMMLAA